MASQTAKKKVDVVPEHMIYFLDNILKAVVLPGLAV